MDVFPAAYRDVLAAARELPFEAQFANNVIQGAVSSKARPAWLVVVSWTGRRHTRCK